MWRNPLYARPILFSYACIYIGVSFVSSLDILITHDSVEFLGTVLCDFYCGLKLVIFFSLIIHYGFWILFCSEWRCYE